MATDWLHFPLSLEIHAIINDTDPCGDNDHANELSTDKHLTSLDKNSMKKEFQRVVLFLDQARPCPGGDLIPQALR